MKTKTFIKKLKRFSNNESKEIKDFIDRFERSLSIGKIKSARLSKSEYEVYLQSPLWREIRKKVFSIRGKICEGCGSTKNIQVHHMYYSLNIMNGESLKGLRVVCNLCHQKIHNTVAREKIGLSVATRKVIKSFPHLLKTK